MSEIQSIEHYQYNISIHVDDDGACLEYMPDLLRRMEEADDYGDIDDLPCYGDVIWAGGQLWRVGEVAGLTPPNLKKIPPAEWHEYEAHEIWWDADGLGISSGMWVESIGDYELRPAGGGWALVSGDDRLSFADRDDAEAWALEALLKEAEKEARHD